MPMHPPDYVKTCPYCGARAAFAQQHEFTNTGADGQAQIWLTLTCPACGGAVLFGIDPVSRDFKRMVPERLGDWTVAHLPPDVDADWHEAVKVFEIAAHRMTVVACGRTLEAAADAREIQGKTLERRIRQMMADNLITGEFGEAMTYVRFIRNTGAHAGQDVPADAAEGTMRFTLQALRLLFEVPGELRRLQGPPAELADGEDSSPE